MVKKVFAKICNIILHVFPNSKIYFIGLHPDPRMQESLANLKFETIREALRGHAMENNVCSTYFAIDETEFDCDENCECQLCQLKIKVYQSFMRLPRFVKVYRTRDFRSNSSRLMLLCIVT